MTTRAWAPLLVALAAGACGGDAAPRSALLITLDTTRLDAVGACGGPQGLTPALDRFASSAVRYEWARTVAPLTLPAHASMMTGLNPPRHTVRGNGPAVLPRDAETVAEAARAAGFQTAGFVACLALDRAFGIAQGFDTWSQPRPKPRRQVGEVSDRPGSEVVRQAVAWLQARDTRRPFFLWVHLFDPHAPYEAPVRYQGERSPYHAEVAAMDAAVHYVLDALEGELSGQVFVAVVADHGEGLGDHGESTHGLMCWDSTLRVPMLLRYRDGWSAGEASSETVSVVDLAPTLLEAMQLPVPEGLDGISLYYGSVPADRGVYFESYEGWRRYGWAPLTGWADAEGKYVRGARGELFETDSDPGEQRDRLALGAELPARYVAGLADLAARPALESAGDRAVGERVLEEMARLGYGATHERAVPYPDALAELDRPDPRDRLEEHAAIDSARDLVLAGNHAEAVPILEAIVAANAHNAAALDQLAQALVALGRHERAVAVLRARLVLPPEQIATHRDLVRCFTALEDEGQQRFHSTRALELLVETHERRGEREQAAKYRSLLDSVRAGG